MNDNKEKLDHIISFINTYANSEDNNVPISTDAIASFLQDKNTVFVNDLFEKASIVEYKDGDDRRIKFLASIVSEYDIKLAKLNFNIEILNQLRDCLTEPPDDLLFIFRLSVYPIGLFIGLPPRYTKDMYWQKLNTLTNELMQLFPKQDITTQSEILNASNIDSQYEILNINSFIASFNNCIQYVNSSLETEYKNDFKQFIAFYYKNQPEPVDSIEKYTRVYCNARIRHYYEKYLTSAQSAIQRYNKEPDLNTSINNCFQKALLVTYSQMNKRIYSYTYQKFKPVPIKNDLGQWVNSVWEYKYDNSYFGNRLIRSFQNIRISCRELQTDYSHVFNWSKNILFTTNTYDWDINQMNTDNATQLNDKYQINRQTNQPTYKRFVDSIVSDWTQDIDIGFSGIGQTNSLVKSIILLYRIANTFGHTLQYTIKSIAQLLAPIISLPVLIITKLLKFLFKELYYKLIYDNLSDGNTNGILPPLELLVSIVQIAYTILKTLLRPVKLTTTVILHSIHRILQEVFVIIKRFLIKPIIQEPKNFNGDNFLMKVIVFAQDINSKNIKKAVKTARYKRMVGKYENELNAYRKNVFRKAITNYNTAIEEGKFDIPEYDTITVKTMSDVSDDYIQITNTHTIAAVNQPMDPILQEKISAINYTGIILSSGEYNSLPQTMEDLERIAPLTEIEKEVLTENNTIFAELNFPFPLPTNQEQSFVQSYDIFVERIKTDLQLEQMI